MTRQHCCDSKKAERRMHGLFAMNLKACLKLRKAAGYSGHTRRIFISLFLVRDFARQVDPWKKTG
jgi:hypothetical protein